MDRNLFAACCMLFLAACSPCIEIPLQHSPAPNGKYAAYVVDLRCEGSQELRQRVVLRAEGWKRWISKRREIVDLNGLHSLAVRWAADSSVLQIEYSGGAPKQLSANWNDVQIRLVDLGTLASERTQVSRNVAPTDIVAPAEPIVWHGGTGRRKIGHRPRKD